MQKNSTKFICFNAVIAALYVVLTMPFGVISTSSGLQFRPAEALSILPLLFPYTVWGLTIGCAISNLVSAYGIADIILGSITTLIAGLITTKMQKFYLAPLPPIILNALILPLIWLLFAGQAGYLINMAGLLLTQSAVIYGLGVPLYFIAKKHLVTVMSLDTPTDNISLDSLDKK
ncbi:MAG: QueT transporter family protein [Clostridia bacterium]